MNVWLVSPAWRRFEVTELVLAQRRWLCDSLAARGHTATSVIVADDKNLEIAEAHGFHALEYPNDDLGMKFNAGFRYAADHGAEVFVHIGSDDWLHPSTFEVLDTIDLDRPEAHDWSQDLRIWRQGPMVVSQRRATVVHLPRQVRQRLNVRGSHGCIPWFIPRSLLELLDFSPIKRGKMRGIDGALARAMMGAVRPNWHYQDGKVDSIVDFKSDTNITPFGILQHNLSAGPATGLEPLRRSYPGRFVDAAIRLAEALAPAYEAGVAYRKARLGRLQRSCLEHGLDLVEGHA